MSTRLIDFNQDHPVPFQVNELHQYAIDHAHSDGSSYALRRDFAIEEEEWKREHEQVLKNLENARRETARRETARRVEKR